MNLIMSYSKTTLSLLALMLQSAVYASSPIGVLSMVARSHRGCEGALRLSWGASRCWDCGSRLSWNVPGRDSGADLDVVVFARTCVRSVANLSHFLSDGRHGGGPTLHPIVLS